MTVSVMNKRDRKNLLFFDINPGKNFTTFGTGKHRRFCPAAKNKYFAQKWIFLAKKLIF